MYKLLVADDETGIRELIRKYAEFEGYTVAEASDGMEAVERCRKEVFDLVILDVMMPKLEGFSAGKLIRQEQEVPVIILSARGEEYDKIHGFEIGIDDYVVKPFSPKELMMRVAAVLKRVQGSHKGIKTECFDYEDLHIDFTARIVSISQQRLELTPKEYALLFYMVKHAGIALTREQLLKDVWGYDFYGDDRTLDTHIKLLRKSIGRYATLIVTLRGVGYRFEVPK